MQDAAVAFVHRAFGSDPGRKIFPGSQPVSIERRHFPILKSNDYVVCEKTDGERVLVVAFTFQHRRVCALVNRAFKVTDVSMINLRPSAYRGTILDAELCDDGRIMVFDGLMLDANPIGHLDFLQRLEAIDTFARSVVVMRFDKHRLAVKTFHAVNDFDAFADEYLPSVSDRVDGVIFTPVNCPVVKGTHETCFKWKPRDANTIDFKLTRGKLGDWRLNTQEKGKDVFVCHPDACEPWFREGLIVECELVGDDGWRAIKPRADKTHANSRRTYFRTLVNLREDIRIEEFKDLLR